MLFLWPNLFPLLLSYFRSFFLKFRFWWFLLPSNFVSLFAPRLIFSMLLSWPLFYRSVLLPSFLLSFCQFWPSSFFSTQLTSHISGTTGRKWAPWVGMCSPWDSGYTLPGFSVFPCLEHSFAFFAIKILLSLKLRPQTVLQHTWLSSPCLGFLALYVPLW